MGKNNMFDVSKRRFMQGALAAGAAGSLVANPFGKAFAQMSGPADMVVRNAKVTTIDPRNPSAQAFAVKDGIFYRVGSNSEVSDLVGRNTTVIDAKRHRIIPGLNDSHTWCPRRIGLWPRTALGLG